MTTFKDILNGEYFTDIRGVLYEKINDMVAVHVETDTQWLWSPGEMVQHTYVDSLE